MFSKKSGYQFKKIRKEKLAQQEDVLNKTKKVDGFLCKNPVKKPIESAEKIDAIKLIDDSSGLKSLSPMSKVDLSDVNEDEMCNGKKLMEVQVDNSTEEVKRFPTDPADWSRSASFIKFCAVHGTWQDTRNMKKSKAAAIKRHIGGTGGGSNVKLNSMKFKKKFYLYSAKQLLAFLEANELCIEELIETITYNGSENGKNEPPLTTTKTANENYYEPSTYEP
ncbi:hypothetical protein ACI65C_004466 [Semiaphis heraclei]